MKRYSAILLASLLFLTQTSFVSADRSILGLEEFHAQNRAKYKAEQEKKQNKNKKAKQNQKQIIK